MDVQKLGQFFQNCHLLEPVKEAQFMDKLQQMQNLLCGQLSNKREKEVAASQCTQCQTQPKNLEIRKQGRGANVPRIDIKYTVYFVRENLKIDWVMHRLKALKKAVILVKTKTIAMELVKSLSGSGITCAVIGREFPKNKRDLVIAAANEGEYSAIVMTDISNVRICNIDSVINFHVAESADVHLQREKIFCESEKNRDFEMIMLMSEEDAFLAPKLVKILEDTGRTVPQMLCQMAQKRLEHIKSKSNYFKGKNYYNMYKK